MTMQKSILVIFSLLAIFIVACNYSSNRKPKHTVYTKDGLSFTLPEYWEVEEDRPVKNTPRSRFISVINNEPLNKDAYFIMTAIDSGNNLNRTLQMLVQQSRISYSKRKIEFGLLDKPKEKTIGQHKTLSVDFETRVIANRNKGSITVFNYKDKTYSFVSSIDIKDKKENFSVMDSVIKTLRVQ